MNWNHCDPLVCCCVSFPYGLHLRNCVQIIFPWHGKVIIFDSRDKMIHCIKIYCDTIIKILIVIQMNSWRYKSFLYDILYFPEVAVGKSKYIKKNNIYHMYRTAVVSWDLYRDTYHIVEIPNRFTPIRQITMLCNYLSMPWIPHFGMNILLKFSVLKKINKRIFRLSRWEFRHSV